MSANLKRFGLEPVIAINRFDTDTEDEISAIQAIANQYGVEAVVATHWTHGGAGATTLARAVLDRLEQGLPDGGSNCSTLTNCPCATRSRRLRPVSTALPGYR